MQKMDEVIKGLEYLSEEDKDRILKARGIEMPEISAKAQHKMDREENRKSEEQNFMNTTPAAVVYPPSTKPDKPTSSKPCGMRIHIDLSTYGKNGAAFHLEGDIYSQEDLAAIHDRFKDYMPRRKLWGLF